MIFLECYLDTHLLDFMGFSKYIIHSGNKGKVLRGVIKNKLGMGIIDDDENANYHPILRNFNEIEFKHNLRLLQHNVLTRVHVILFPRDIETWLMVIAKVQECKLDSFGVLNYQNKLKKRYEQHELGKLADFFSCISQNRSFIQFIEWINKYCQNN